MSEITKDWRNDIYAVFKDLNITMVSHVPDAGHTPLINLCEKDNEIDVVTLTTEQDGVGLSCGGFVWSWFVVGCVCLELVCHGVGLPGFVFLPFLVAVYILAKIISIWFKANSLQCVEYPCPLATMVTW